MQRAPLFLPSFDQNHTSPVSFTEIRPVTAVLIRAQGRTDQLAGITKVICVNKRQTEILRQWSCGLIERYWLVALIQYTACLRKAARKGATIRNTEHRGQYSEPHECICLYHMLYICFFLSPTSFYIAMVRCRGLYCIWSHTRTHHSR